jgi:hypothetical protein
LSAVRFYLDEDSANAALLPPIRGAGIDIETAIEVGLRQASDAQQIAHVLTTGRVIITGDHRLRQALINITRQGSHHPGILYLPARDRQRIGDIVFTLQLVHACCTAEEMVDTVTFIPI